MTPNEKKKYLSNYRLQQARIRRINEMLVESPCGGEEYLKQIDDAIKLRIKIEKEIAGVENNILSEVLSQKYLCGKTLEEIAYNLNYSQRQLERLHIKALEKFIIS